MQIISRIAGVAFSVGYAVELLPPAGCCADTEAFDPAAYSWSLVGKASNGDPENTVRAFELTTGNGRITIDGGEVLCSFLATDTEGLCGLYRAQLIGTLGAVDDLGGEVDPFQFTVRF